MATKKLKRADVLSLLDKLEAPYTSKITLDRAVKKLERAISKSGIPTHIVPEEQVALEILGLADPEEKDWDEDEPKPEATKKTAAKKKTAAPKEESKPKVKKARADWMTCATKAVMTSSNMEDAGTAATQIFRDAGGKVTPNTDQNGKLYASFASKALIEAKVIRLDGKDIELL